MFGVGYRTPAKSKGTETLTQITSPKPSTNVRRSVGEWEAGAQTSPKGKCESQPATKGSNIRTPSPTPATSAAPPGTKKVRKEQSSKTGKTAFSPKLNLLSNLSPKERSEAANSWFGKGHSALTESRNLKGDLKEILKLALNHLHRLYKEAERQNSNKDAEQVTTKNTEKEQIENGTETRTDTKTMDILSKELQEHSRLLLENKTEMERLRDTIQKYNEERPTYADTLKTNQVTPEQTTLHSIIVTSKNENDTGEEVLEKVRKAVEAREGWVKVDRVRKARDRKVIMGCRSKEEREKVIKRLEEKGDTLIVEEVKNKDPLLILRDVLSVHSDAEVLDALRKQNKAVFDSLNNEEDKMQIKYRRRARNPHNTHIVLSVSPKIWSRAVAAGKMRVDLQSVRVEDQTPLVQCTRCLGYGHGRRFCKETVDLCGHCGGPHMRDECPDFVSGTPPSCKNCVRAKSHQVDHNAFSLMCPVRKRWDALARATVAYC